MNIILFLNQFISFNSSMDSHLQENNDVFILWFTEINREYLMVSSLNPNPSYANLTH